MSLEYQIAIVLVLLIPSITGTLFLLKLIRSQKAQQAELTEQRGQLGQLFNEYQIKSQEAVQNQFKGIVDTLHTQLQSSQTNMNRHMASSGETLTQVHAKLAGLSKTAENLAQVGADVNRLQDLFKAPKLRGRLGEILLEKLLAQVLPREHYIVQHAFKSGTVVDAAIRLTDTMLVPVDSKFPLEAYQRASEIEDETERRRQLRQFHTAVKKQIHEIATKYIVPDEGTYEFALMYIPSESVYYQIVTDSAQEADLIEYALNNHVVPVSPNTFYAYLSVIAYGLKGLRIEQEAHNIRAQLASLDRVFLAFMESFQILGKHLANAQTKHGEADKLVSRFSDQLSRVSGQTDGAISAPGPIPLARKSQDSEQSDLAAS